MIRIYSDISKIGTPSNIKNNRDLRAEQFKLNGRNLDIDLG